VKQRSQQGALMVGVVALIAISLVWSAVAFQAWVDVLRRDNEAEMIFRAEEIVRAIQRYRRDHGGQGPRKLEELLEPSPKRSYYLRRKYDDPLVPDGKWGLLLMGPSGTIIDPNAEEEEGLGLGLLGGGLGSGPANSDSSSISGLGQNLSGSQPTDAGQLGGIGNSGSGGGDETASGLPIAGVRTLSTDEPFRVYKGESDYSKWLFTYLDIQGHGGPAGKVKGKSKGGLKLKGKGKI
jgi:hypothetical protein